MPREKLLVDSRAGSTVAKRVLASATPDDFRPAFSRVGQAVLSLLAGGPKYPAEIARALRTHHQIVYYHVRRLERAGLIARVGSEVIRGGAANRFALSSDGYAVEFGVKGEHMPTLQSSSRSKALGRLFAEFIGEGAFHGWIVVGSPIPHGRNGTQARDGHYAIQLGMALGQFVGLPEFFPVKLDVDIKSEKLERSNLIVVGGPRTNLISEELNDSLPVRFRQGGFWGSIVDSEGNSYNAELDCVVVKTRNPWNKGNWCVVVAGLTGAATKAAIIGITGFADTVLRGYRSGEFACILRGVDRDGDGKVDSVDVLKRP
jgi:DNA-binding transcriptional ArsR family regulator